jgi:hypothetical protein
MLGNAKSATTTNKVAAHDTTRGFSVLLLPLADVMAVSRLH